MARLRAGILGNVRGKVAGVVGSQWKDKNYIREYIKPANPNTSAQQAQRTLMSNTVNFCKSLVGPVFNAYTDIFYKGMSGFNFFIKRNITFCDDPIVYANIKLTEGKLSPVIPSAAVYTTGSGDLTIAFDKNLGNNGSDTDKIYVAALNIDTEVWYFPAAEVDRSTETISLTLPTGITATNIRTYIWPIKYSNTLVDIIGNAAHLQGEAA